IDRGTTSGVQKGMAVVTPAGIVGRILAVYPFASQVLSVNDAGFAAGVESQKNHVHGVLKGVGAGAAKMDYVPTGQKIETGELLFTSGEDRVFPRGLLVGKVTGVGEGSNFQAISVQPSAAEAAPEEVLVIVDPAHQEIPQAAAADAPVFLAPALKTETQAADPVQKPGPGQGTQADKMMDQYKKLGDSQKYKFGEGGPGSVPLNFNLKVPGVNAPALPVGSTPVTGNNPAAAGAPAGVKPAVPPAVKPAVPGSSPAPAKPVQPKPVQPKPVEPNSVQP
ncbi:MAG: rod shape-determining protein MreC, partial [Bryobacterales bacterium]|nr:rod shape-determining protein MreC [Bryobacterales bacterium]